jgi:hypothetical protein
MNESAGPSRRVALGNVRLVYKCETKEHLKVEDDLSDDPEVRAKNDHEGCEVHTVYINAGSAPFTPPDCRTCGGKMVLVDGDLPSYGELPTDAAGLVDHQQLLDLIAAQGGK